MVQRSIDSYPVEYYLSDWAVSPNEEEVIIYLSDEDDEDAWHTRGTRLGKDDYVAIYEYPRKETDMPVFMRA